MLVSQPNMLALTDPTALAMVGVMLSEGVTATMVAVGLAITTVPVLDGRAVRNGVAVNTDGVRDGSGVGGL